MNPSIWQGKLRTDKEVTIDIQFYRGILRIPQIKCGRQKEFLNGNWEETDKYIQNQQDEIVTSGK